MSPKKRGALTLVVLSPALLALSGCSNPRSNPNCDSNRSTATTSDDCGTGRRSGGAIIGGGFFRGGGSRNGGASVGSGSTRGGFGSSGSSAGTGGFGGGG